jgi:hypothetical protein
MSILMPCSHTRHVVDLEGIGAVMRIVQRATVWHAYSPNHRGTRNTLRCGGLRQYHRTMGPRPRVRGRF